MCDHRSMVGRATHLAAGAGDVAPQGSVRFSDEIIVVGGSFAPSQVLSFGSLDNVADYNSEFHPHEENLSYDNESRASYTPLGLLGADLEVLA